MKKILAVMFGLMIGFTSMGMAEPSTVESYLQNDFVIKVDGEFKYHPEGLKPLVYQNRTYLPASFIVQLLGGSTTFDSSAKTVNIISKPEITLDQDKITEYETKIKELENKIEKLESSAQVTSDYVKVPTSISQNGYRMTIEGIAVREEGRDGRLYFKLKNNDIDTKVKLNAFATTIEVDGEVYNASANFPEDLNMDLFKWLKINDEIQGYIPFSKLPKEEDIKNMIITIVVEKNEANTQNDTLVFKVSNN